MLKEIYEKIPVWGKVGAAALAVGYFIGRSAVPVHTETTSETKKETSESENNKKSETHTEDKSKTSEESSKKTQGPIKIITRETKPDGTKVDKIIVIGPKTEEKNKKETDSTKKKDKKDESTNKDKKSSETTKQTTVTQPLPSYSVGAHIKTPVDEITSNHLKKELDVTAGYRVYKGLWIEGVVSTPMDFKKPTVGVGFRIEF
jgi:hypothetical protein